MNLDFKYCFVFLIAFVCSMQSLDLQAQEVRVIKYQDLADIIEEDNGSVKIINFWATWCKPCVKELPQFQKLRSKLSDKEAEIILVSFDFVEDLDSRLKPFIKKKGINSKVVLLDETDYNSFIDKVDPSWSGAIPATLMINYRNDTKQFFEKEFAEGELESTYIEFTK